MLSLKNLVRRMALAKQLKSEESKERLAAVEELGDIGDPADIKVIAGAFRDPEPLVRIAAANALMRIDDPRAVSHLIAGLAVDAGAGPWQVDILDALEHFHDPRSVSACIDTLPSGDAKVRRAAARALGTLGDEAAVPALLKVLSDENPEVSREASFALAKIGPAASAGLMQAIQDSTIAGKIAAANALGIIGDPAAIPALVAALQDKDSYLQIAVANALARFNDPAVVAPLIRALEESSSAAFNYGVREEATMALLKMGPAVIAPLLESLKNSTPRARLIIIKLLGELPDPRSIEPLAAMLKDADPDVRNAALGVLAKVDRDRATEFLPPLLDDPDATVCHLAGEALLRAGWQAGSPRDRARLAIAVGRYPQALNEGEDGIQLLVQRLQNSAPAVRRQATVALGGPKDPRFLPCFQTALVREPAAEVQQALAEAMEGCGPAAVEPLRAVLEQGDWGARRWVSQSLLRLSWQPQTEREYVLCALAMGNVEAVVAVGISALDLVRQALQANDSQVQSAAAATLQKIQPGTA